MGYIVFIVLACSFAFGGGKEKSRADSFAGCYESTIHSGKRTGIPKRFTLINQRIKDDPYGTLQLSVIGPTRNSFKYRHSGWRVIGKDRLDVGFNSGTGGSYLKLRKYGDMFMGTATEGGDAGDQGPIPQYNVSIRRIACP
jgi:hypothetical protein